MKQERYTLINEAVRSKLIRRINEIECDGKISVSIGGAGTKSARQRGLDWQWNNDIANSGIGGNHEDTAEGVHLVCKYRWAIPIFIRDDPYFADLYAAFHDKYYFIPERMEWFVDTQVHTEKMSVSQVAEYMKNKQRYYLDKGVNLTNPDDLGLLEG